MSDSKQDSSAETAAEQQFRIEKLFVKDVSFETPKSPEIFQAEWKPEVNVELGNSWNKLGDQPFFEVVLSATVTVKLADEIAYLAEVKQAGIFFIEGFQEEQIQPLLGSYCPNVLFPFAREVIADLVQKGGFPPFYLQPVNFDAIYAQQVQQQKDQRVANVTH